MTHLAGNRRRLVFHGGALVSPERATLPVGSIALRYGVSVFEGIRAYRTDRGDLRPWLLEQHLARLQNSCALMELCPPDDVVEAIGTVLRANGHRDDSYVRVAVSAGSAGGISDDTESLLTVSAVPMGRKKWLSSEEGMSLAIGEVRRAPESSFPSAAKNISAYAGPRLAERRAHRAGYDGCLLLTVDGLVSEAPTATVVLVEGDSIVTPGLEHSVLPGVTRAWVMATAAHLGMPVGVEDVSVARLLAADELFLCGTGIEIAPVRAVDGHPVGDFGHRPVTLGLIGELFAQARGSHEITETRWVRTMDRTMEVQNS
jgi:branched-chain amino acid aminotransferase